MITIPGRFVFAAIVFGDLGLLCRLLSITAAPARRRLGGASFRVCHKRRRKRLFERLGAVRHGIDRVKRPLA